MNRQNKRLWLYIDVDDILTGTKLELCCSFLFIQTSNFFTVSLSEQSGNENTALIPCKLCPSTENWLLRRITRHLLRKAIGFLCRQLFSFLGQLSVFIYTPPTFRPFQPTSLLVWCQRTLMWHVSPITNFQIAVVLAQLFRINRKLTFFCISLISAFLLSHLNIAHLSLSSVFATNHWLGGIQWTFIEREKKERKFDD